MGCPNLLDENILQEFLELKSIVGERLAYLIYDKRNSFFRTNENGLINEEFIERNKSFSNQRDTILSMAIEELENIDSAYIEKIKDSLNEIDVNTNTKENIKPGVSELFESNPKLANDVYEALGFGQESNNISTFTNYSGAAQGGDTIWENIGKEFGLGKQVNYRPEDLKKLTKEQLKKVEDAYQQAVKDLGRIPLDVNTFAGGLVRRDYLQAKAADAVFAISTIVEPGQKDSKGYINKTNKSLVAGGTGYAVQMAINLGKPVYVFDQNKNQWFVWEIANLEKDGIEYEDFVPTGVPILTTKFAGIGTRELNENGKQAIRNVYEKTTQFQITPQQKQQAQIKFQGYINATGRQDVEGFKEFVRGKQFQKLTEEEKAKTIEQVTKEHRSITALKDLSAKLAHRIGGKVKFENKSDVDWKGYNQGITSVLNEAYMTPDTPFHEVLAHPIIRAIKSNKHLLSILDYSVLDDNGFFVQKAGKTIAKFPTREQAQKYIDENSKDSALYQSLLKELETGRGKEVFEQVKRDYKYKEFDIIKNIVGRTIFKNKIDELKTQLDNIPKFPDLEDFEIKKSNILKSTFDIFSNGKSLGTVRQDVGYFYWTRPSGKIVQIGKSSNVNDAFRKVIFKTLKKEFDVKYNVQKLQNEISKFSEVITVVKGAGDTSKGKYYLTNESGNDLGNYSLEALKTIIGEENLPIYNLEEQQEEAIVTLLGELAAGKLEEKENASLKKKLLEFWKQISDFVRQLLLQDEIRIDELPITTTLNDLAEIMGYGNNKIILPGYKVEYSTPLGNKYDTLEEVNNEIKGLANNNIEVDLSGVKIYNSKITKDNLPKDFVKTFGIASGSSVFLADDRYNDEFNEKNRLLREKYKDKFVVAPKDKYGLYLDQYNENQVFYNTKEEAEEEALELSVEEYNKNNRLSGFIEKNKEYEQSREIIEQWKKENNIQYDPEEVYSRGQEFYHIKDAYFDSAKDTELWVQGLLGVLDDYERAGTRMELSFATAPQGEVGKGMRGMPEARKNGALVYITAYPQSEDIIMASKVDNNTSSFGHMNGLEKVFTNRDNTITGIALTKSVPLHNINTIEPNLADTIDDVAHHNESVVALTKNNFRIHYGENVAYEVKQIIDKFNKILDDKYGKLEKPDIKREGSKIETYGHSDDGSYMYVVRDSNNEVVSDFETYQEAENYVRQNITKYPTQTRDNTTSIESVKDRIAYDKRYTNHPEFKLDDVIYKHTGKGFEKTFYDEMYKNGEDRTIDITEDEYREAEKKYRKQNNIPDEYNQQALTNLKIAALKEVARKYPRSLITSKVVPINPNMADNSEIQYSKVGSKQDTENFANFVAYENSDFSKIGNINQFRDYIMSKNFAAIEEFLVVNNKIDRKC